MACFIVPLSLGIVLSIIERIWKRLSEKIDLSMLRNLMLGGSVILALEHVWHGEVVPYPPFLTAMNNPSEIPVMINEMLTAGTLMTIAVTGVWSTLLMLRKHYSKTLVKAKTITQVHRTLS